MTAAAARDRRIGEEAARTLAALPASARPQRQRPTYTQPEEPSDAMETTDTDLTREEKIELLTNALWRTSDEKLDIIAAVIDL